MKAGWSERPLGELVTLHYGKPLPRSERTENGKFPVYGANGIKSYSDKYLVAKPSIIVGRKGSAGEINIATENFWPLDVTYFTEHDSNTIDFGFLHYLLEMQELPLMARGVKPGINRNDVYALNVSAPPLEEQKRIVAVLDEAFAGLDRARAHCEANLQNARDLFESKLKSAFSDVCVNWTLKKLTEVTSKIGSGATPRGGAASYKSEGISLVRSMNVHDRNFVEQKLAFIDEEQAAKLDNVTLQNRDVLINITGASVARCCVLPSDVLPARVNQHVSILRSLTDMLLPEFLCYMLTSEPYKDVLLGIGEEGGATRQAITKAQLQSLDVAFPSMEEQNEIVNSLDNAEKSIRQLQQHYQAKLTDLDDLRQSLLQKAFAGELT